MGVNNATDLKKRLKEAANAANKKTKKTTPKVSSYVKNVAKSFAHSTMDLSLRSMSNFKSFAEVNAEVVSDLHKTAINPKGAIGNYFNSIIDSEARGSLKKAASYMVEDLKTGKFYDRDRSRSDFESMNSELLDDFGGFDEFDSWGNDSGIGEPTDADKIIENDYRIAEIQEEKSSSRTRAAIMAMGDATDAIITTQTSHHNSSMKLSMGQHAQTMLAFDNIMNVNISMMEAQSLHFGQLNNLLQESTALVAGKLDETNSILREIKTALIPGRENKSRKQQELPIEDNGTFNAKKYIKQVMKNFDDETQLSTTVSMMMNGQSVNDLVKLFSSNPLEFMVSMTVGSLIPKALKKTMDNLNTSFGAFFSNLLTKVGSKRNEDGMTGMIARIFGLDVKNNVRIELDSYRKGKYEPKNLTESLLSKIEKSTSEVIPSLLRDIVKGITGKQSKIYDYSLGKFVDPVGEMKRIYDRTENLHNDMDIAKNYVTDNMSKVNMKSSDKKKLASDLNKTLQYYAEKGQNINPYGAKPKELSDVSNDSWAFIAGVLQSMPRHMLMAASAQGAQAKMKRNMYNANLSDMLVDTGLSTLFNGSDEFYDKYYRDLKSGDIIEDKKYTAASYLKGADKDFTGLNLTNKILYDIRDVLKRGIIVYPDKGGASNNSPFRNSAYKDRATYLDKQSKENITTPEKDYMLDGSENFLFSYSGTNNADDLGRMFRQIVAKENAKKEKDEQIARENNPLYIKSLSERKNGMIGKLNNLLANPFSLINNTLEAVDRGLFRVIYGKEAAELAGDSGSLLNFVLNTIESGFHKVTDWFDEKLFGEDGWLSKRFNTAKNKAYEKYINPALTSAKNYMIGPDGLLTPMVDSVKGELGKMTGGFSPASLRESFGYGKRAASSGLTINTKDMNMVERASYELFKGVKGVTSTISSVFLGDDFVDEEGNTKKTRSKEMWEDITKEFKGFMPKGIAGAIVGAGAWTGAGLLTGLFLPGGPILAGIIGSGTAFINQSDRFREYVFGKGQEVDENGNVISQGKNGLIDREIVDGFKKFAPKVALGAGIGGFISNFGIMGASLLPGGPIMGSLIGSIAGMTLASDQMRELLFGKKDDETGEDGLFSKNTRKKMVEALGIGAGGAAAGFIAGTTANSIGLFGLSLLPGGPVMAAIGGITATLNADRIKRYFFGDEEIDENGKKKNNREGLFAKAFDTVKDDIFEPMMSGINKRGYKVKNWFQVSIVDSFKESLNPLKESIEESKKHIRDAFANIGDSIKSSLNSTFKSAFGDDIQTLFKEKVIQPLTKKVSSIVDAFGRFIGNILAFPFKALNSAMRKREESKDAKLAKQRKKEARQEKFNEYKDKMTLLTGKFNSILYDSGLGFAYGRRKMSSNTSIEEAIDNQISGEVNPKGKSSKFKDFLLKAKASWDTNLFEANESLKERKEAKQIAKESKKAYEENEKRLEEESRSSKYRKRQEAKDAKKAKREERLDKKERISQNNKEAKIAQNEAKAARAEEESSTDGKAKNYVYSNAFKKSVQNMSKDVKAIKDEIKGQINGLGWNLAYIRNILLNKFGSDAPLPESGEKAMSYDRPAGFLKRAMRAVSRKAGAVGDFVSNKVADAKDWVSTLPIFAPLLALGKGAKKIGGAIGSGAKGAIGLIGDLGKVGMFMAESLAAGLKTGFTVLTETVKTVGHSLREMLTESLAGIGKGLGEIAYGLGGLGRELLGGIGLIFNGGAEAFKIILPELVRGGIGGVKLLGKGVGAVGKGLYKGTKFVLGGVAKKIFGYATPNGLDLFSDKKEIFGDVTIKGIHLGLANKELHPVTVLNGLVTGLKPTTALPVYVLGGDINSRIKDSQIFNEDAENKPENARKKYGLIGNLTMKVKRKLTEGKDFEKELGTSIGRLRSKDEKEALDLAIASEMLENRVGVGGSGKEDEEKKKNSIWDFLKDAFMNSAFGKALAAGAGTLMSALFPFLLPIIGTTAAVLNGDTERVIANGIKVAAKFLPKGDRTIGNLFKMVKEQAVKGAGFVKAQAGRAIDSGKNTLAKAKAMMSSKKAIDAVEAVDDAVKVTNNVTKTMTKSGKAIKVASKSAKIAEELAEASKPISVVTKNGKTLTVTAKGATTAAKATTEAATNAKSVTTIMGAIKKFFTDGKVVKAIGGSKAIKSITPFIEALSKVLMTKAAPVLGKIVAKVAAWPVTIALAVYDLTTGMADAANMLEIPSEDVTWKMRIVAGLSKAISGILFGCVPTTWLATNLYKLISNDADDEKLVQAQKKMVDNYYAYKASTDNPNLTFEEYNKQTNRTFAGKVWDGVKGAVTGTTTAVKNVVTGGAKLATDAATNAMYVSAYGATGIYLKAILDVLSGANPDKALINKAAGLLNSSIGISPGNYVGGYSTKITTTTTTTKPAMFKFGLGVGMEGGEKGYYNPSKPPVTTNQVTNFAQTMPNSPNAMNYNIDNIVYYSQTDAKWKGTTPNASFSNYGCGPTVAAMIISSYTGSAVTPTDMDKAASTGKFKNKLGATEVSFFPYIAKKYKVKIYTGVKSLNAILKQLNEKKPIIILGKSSSAKDKTTPFNTQMHYMIISSYDKTSNTFSIIDPYGTSTGKFPVSSVLRDTSSILFTSNYNGMGVDAYKAKDAAKKAYKTTSKDKTQSTLSSTPTTTGVDVESDNGELSEDNKVTNDLYGMISNIGNFFGAFVDKAFGFKYDDEALTSALGFKSPTEDVASKYPASSYSMPMMKNKWLSGDTDMQSFVGLRLAKVAENEGKVMQVTSGYRSTAEQQRIWDKRKREHPGEPDSVTRKWVAKPGNSRHESGLAADVGGWAKSLPNSVLAQYGLVKPLSNENWHIEPLEIQGLSKEQIKKQFPLNAKTYAAQVENQNKKFGMGVGDDTPKKFFTPASYDKTRKFNETGSILEKVTKQAEQIKEVVNSAGDSKLLELLTSMLDKQLELLRIIAENTANPVAVATSSGGSTPTVRANNSAFLNAIKKR